MYCLTLLSVSAQAHGGDSSRLLRQHVRTNLFLLFSPSCTSCLSRHPSDEHPQYRQQVALLPPSHLLCTVGGLLLTAVTQWQAGRQSCHLCASHDLSRASPAEISSHPTNVSGFTASCRCLPLQQLSLHRLTHVYWCTS